MLRRRDASEIISPGLIEFRQTSGHTVGCFGGGPA